MRPSSDSSTNSDAMSGQLNDVIFMLHAPDGSSWSTFMANRLELAPYEIKSISKDLTILEAPPQDGNQETEGELYLNTADVLSDRAPDDGKAGEQDNSTDNASSVASTGESDVAGSTSAPETADALGELKTRTLPKTDSTVSAVTLTENSSTEDCILYSRACIVFLSPNIVERECPFPLDISTLNPRSTVFLLLGVDIEEVRRFFGPKSDIVFKCLCCHIDGSEVSICDALVQVVNAYEGTGGSSSVGGGSDLQDFDPDDVSGGGIYQSPSSVQLNRVERVFPKELTGGDRLVYVLLEQTPEHEVVIDIGTGKEEFPLTRVADRLFSFSVPDDISGKVSFEIGSRGHHIGCDSVRVLSKLDQLHEILMEEVDPKTILTQAVGLDPHDDAGLDTALAFKLQQLASAQTFAAMFPVEEGLQTKGPAKQVMYPTLLHFAADFNLRTFCSELLRYPSMVGAIQAENRDGETPQQMAARKKYEQLESDLAQFATRNGVTTPAAGSSASPTTGDSENSLYVEPNFPRGPPPPAHKLAKRAGYVNDGVDAYITMEDLQPAKPDLISLKQQLSQVEGGRSKREKDFPGTTTKFRNDFNDDEDDDDEDGMDGPIEYHNTRTDSGIGQNSRPGSVRSSPRDRLDSPISAGDAPRTSAKKALKVLGLPEDEFHRSSRHGSLPSEDLFPGHTPERNRFFSNSAPKSMGSGTLSPQDHYRMSVSSNCSEQFDTVEQISPKQSKGKMKIIKNLLRGKTKDKRSSSIPALDSSDIKAVIYGRGRRGSESSANTLHREEERDSGSYSDEEKEKSSAPVNKRSNKNKAFKEREAAMTRRLSRRVQHAMNEKIDQAPTLPSRAGRRRGAFKSFILD